MGKHSNVVINMEGGLDLASPHYMIQQNPGVCRELINYEASVEGGYKRVKGFTKWGTARVGGLGVNSPVLGMSAYANGIVAVISDGVYYSEDGTTWTQVNRDSYAVQTGTVQVSDSGSGLIDVTGVGTTFLTDYDKDDEQKKHIRINNEIREIASITDNETMTVATAFTSAAGPGIAHYKNGATAAQLAAGAEQARTGQGGSHVEWYEDYGDYGALIISDQNGANDAAVFAMQGTSPNYTYEYDTLTNAEFGAPSTPYHAQVFNNRMILAGTPTQHATVFWGDRFSVRRWDGPSAGSATINEHLINVQPFKDRLILFCRNSIHQLVNLDDPTGQNTQILSISSRTGIAAEESVQELGGDLIFLSHDGIRMLQATDQYGDVTMGTVSRQIDPLVIEILEDLPSLRVVSTTIRELNQYRLFYYNSPLSDLQQKGLCGVYKPNSPSGYTWQWSELHGWPITAITSTANDFSLLNLREEVYHGGYDGYIYKHNDGLSLGDESIIAYMQLYDIDYGDIGTKKTLHYVTIFGETEGSYSDLSLRIRYDFNSPNTHQPNAYAIPEATTIAFYGSATFGAPTVFGGTSNKILNRILVHGSGYSNDFSFIDSSTSNNSYSINSMFIDFRAGDKR